MKSILIFQQVNFLKYSMMSTFLDLQWMIDPRATSGLTSEAFVFFRNDTRLQNRSASGAGKSKDWNLSNGWHSGVKVTKHGRIISIHQEQKYEKVTATVCETWH